MAHDEKTPPSATEISEDQEIQIRVQKLAEETAELVASRLDSFKRNVHKSKEGVPAGGAVIKGPWTGAREPEAVEVKKGDDGDATHIDRTNTLPSADEANTLFTNAGAVFPPYDPDTLTMLLEHSNALRPNVDAYAVNIDMFGYRFEPAIDLDSKDADKTIGDAIFLDRLHQAGDNIGAAGYPTPEDIVAKRTEIEHTMRLEKAKLTTFFDSCVQEKSIEELRGDTRIDVEQTGNAYWEILRNGKGEIAQFTYVPSYSVRLMPVDHHFTDVRVRTRISPLSFEHTTMQRRFRRYCQVIYNRLVFFKEFGDPRCVDAKTGQYYASLEKFKSENPEGIPATELVHFKVHSSRTPYGVPRWIGALLSVLGSRAAEEVNYLYFDNKAVPPLAVLVSGGRLTETAKSKIESYIKDNIKGKENFHRILIIEAVSASGPQQLTDSGNVRIELKPLRDAQQQDALFQEYDQQNIDKIGMMFRLPRLLRGDVRDFNRATADAALKYTEMQVFQPERQRFDGFINRHILAPLGIRFWKFASNSPIATDPEALSTILTRLATVGALTPADVREFGHELFNRELKKIDEPWTLLPMPLTQAGIIPGGGSTGAAPAAGAPMATSDKPAPAKDDQLGRVANALTAIRSKLQEAEDKAWKSSFQNVKREVEEGSTIVIPVDKAEIDSWFETPKVETGT